MGATLYGRRLSAAATHAHYYAASLKTRQDVALGVKKKAPPVIDLAAPVTWVVLITSRGAEDKIEEALRDAGFQHTYVPRWTYWQSKTTLRSVERHERQRALISRYVFLGLPKGRELRRLDGIDGLLGIMCHEGRPTPVRPRQIAALAQQEREGWFDEARLPALRIERDGAAIRSGDLVKIRIGLFAEHNGVAFTDSYGDQVAVLLNLFGRQTPVVLSISDVEVTRR